MKDTLDKLLKEPDPETTALLDFLMPDTATLDALTAEADKELGRLMAEWDKELDELLANLDHAEQARTP